MVVSSGDREVTDRMAGFVDRAFEPNGRALNLI
jgi:hypothetical protein